MHRKRNINFIIKKKSENEITQRMINTWLINLFKDSANIALRVMNGIHDFTDEEMIIMFGNHFTDNFSGYDSWISYGYQHSNYTDIYIAVFIRQNTIEDGKIKPLSQTALGRLYYEIKECGYDIDNRNVDITLVYFNPKTKSLDISSKNDPKRIEATIVATWDRCKQKLDGAGNIPLAIILNSMKSFGFDAILLNKMNNCFIKMQFSTGSIEIDSKVLMSAFVCPNAFNAFSALNCWKPDEIWILNVIYKGLEHNDTELFLTGSVAKDEDEISALHNKMREKIGLDIKDDFIKSLGTIKTKKSTITWFLCPIQEMSIPEPKEKIKKEKDEIKNPQKIDESLSKKSNKKEKYQR